MSDITDEQIRQMRSDAMQRGDTEALAICDLALAGVPTNRTVTVRGQTFDRDAARRACAMVLDIAAALLTANRAERGRNTSHVFRITES